MLTEFISAKAILEIGNSLSEIFGVPLVISDSEGTLLFISENWSANIDFINPLNIRTIIKDSRKSRGRVEGTGTFENYSVVPVVYEDTECAYGIIDVAGLIPEGKVKVDRVVSSIEKSLNDISIYASWAANLERNDAKNDVRKIAGLFQSGGISLDEILRKIADYFLNISSADAAVINTISRCNGNFQPEIMVGDVNLLSLDCLRNCKLGCWTLQEKQPVFVRNPRNDPRCTRNISNEIKTVSCWPLFVRDRSYGTVVLISKTDREHDPWKRDCLDMLAIQTSFILDVHCKETMINEYSYKINALKEVSRVITSSLDLSTVLNLVSDMSMHVSNAGTCCLYLKEKKTGILKLMIAKGVKPGEFSSVSSRFDDSARQEDTAAEDFLDFSITAKDEEIGYLSLGNYDPAGFSEEDREMVKVFASLAGIAVSNRYMFEEAESTLLETITVLSLAIEARDKMMFGHSEMVRELSVALAEQIGLAQNEIAVIEPAGLLHDIGKLAVSESTLNKTGSLNAREYEEFKRHPHIGAEILSAVTSFDLIRDIVKYHHERFDGSGYPEGLKGEEIPRGARILAIADTFASLVSTRTYRSARDPFQAVDIIKANAGTQFDPALVEAFEKVVRKRYSLKIDIDQNKNNSPRKQMLAAYELGLTEREGEILGYIAIGMTNREIAEALYLSEKTVKTHVTHILRKLNLNDRTKAAIYAIQKGLVNIVKKS